MTSVSNKRRHIWYHIGISFVPLPVPNFTFIGILCRPCGAKNAFFSPLSKRNTSRLAAVRAGLPVSIVSCELVKLCYISRGGQVASDKTVKDEEMRKVN